MPEFATSASTSDHDLNTDSLLAWVAHAAHVTPVSAVLAVSARAGRAC